MKKFMIYFLMAFLFIGTCQARSEVVTGDLANAKVLSYAYSPTISECLTSSPARPFAAPLPGVDAWDVSLQIDVVDIGVGHGGSINLPLGTRVQLGLWLSGGDELLVEHANTTWEISTDGTTWEELPGTTGKDSIVIEPWNEVSQVQYRATVFNADKSESTSTVLNVNYQTEINYDGLTVAAQTVLFDDPTTQVSKLCGDGKFSLALNTKKDAGRRTDTLIFSFYDQSGTLIAQKTRLPYTYDTYDNRGDFVIIDAAPYADQIAGSSAEFSFYGTVTTKKGRKANGEYIDPQHFNPVMYSNIVTLTFYKTPEVSAFVPTDVDAVCVGTPLEIHAKLDEGVGIGAEASNVFAWDVAGVDENNTWEVIQNFKTNTVQGYNVQELYETSSTPNYDTLRARVEVYQDGLAKSLGCYATDTIDVVVYDNPIMRVSQNLDSLCLSDTLRAGANVVSVDYRLNTVKMHYAWYQCDDAEGSNPTLVKEGSAATDAELDIAMESEPGQYYYMVEARYDSTGIPACETEAHVISVNVIAPPVFAFVNTDTLCVGGEAELSAEATIKRSGLMTYMWEALANDKQTVVDTLPTKFFTEDNSNVVTGVLATDSFFRVTAQLVNPNMNNTPYFGCRVDSIIQVKVYPDPEITYLTEDFTMCLGGDSTLVVRATNNAEDISDLFYEWNTLSSSGTDTTFNFVAEEFGEGVHKVEVKVYNEDRHESCYTIDSLRISIIEFPVVELTQNDSICYGGTAVVEGPSFSIDSCADMNYRYFWTAGEGAEHTTWTVSDTVAVDCSTLSATTNKYTVENHDLTVVNKDFDKESMNTAKFYFNIVSDMPGCVVKDSTIISFYPDPVISVQNDTTYICEGTGQNLYVQYHPSVTSSMSYDGEVNYTYILIDAPAEFEGNTPDTLKKEVSTYDDVPMVNVFEKYAANEIKVVKGQYNVEMVVEDAQQLGCDTRDTFTVVVIEDPTILVPNDTILCAYGEIPMTFTVVNPAAAYADERYDMGALRYQLMLMTPDSLVYKAQEGNFSNDTNVIDITFNREFIENANAKFVPSAKPYRLMLTVAAGCSGCDCGAYSDEVEIFVDEPPVIEMIESEATICAGGTVTIEAAEFYDEYLTSENPFRYFWKAMDANDSIAFARTPGVKNNVTDTINIDYSSPKEGEQHLFTIDSVIFSGLQTTGVHKFALHIFSELSGCVATDTFMVNVVEDMIQIASNNDTICQRFGDEVEFEAEVTFDIPEYTYSYQWTYGEGENVKVLKEQKNLPVVSQQVLTLSQETIDNEEFKHFFDSLGEGSHNITLTIHQDVTNCEAVYVNTLVVYPNPSVTIDTNYLKPCADNNTVLTILEDSWNPEFVYYWVGVDVATGDTIVKKKMDANAFPVLTTTIFDEGEERMYYIRAVNELSKCYSVDSIRVAAVENPVHELAAVPSTTEVCAGTPVYLDGIVKPVEDPETQTYAWYKCNAVETVDGSGVYECPEFNPDALCPLYSTQLDTLDTFDEAFDEGAVYCYHLVVNTDGYNCPTHVATPVIKVRPNIQVELTADQDTVCTGGSVVVTATVTNAEAYFKYASTDNKVFYYRVYENNVPISEEMQTLPGEYEISYITHPGLHESENNMSAYIYQIRVSGFSFECQGCDTNDCYSLVPGVQVTVLPDPIAAIEGPSVMPFGYTDTVLVANVSHGYGELTEIQWYKENVAIEGATGETLRLPANLSYGDHHYYVDVKQSASGCQTLSPVFTLHVMDTVILDVDVDAYDCAQKTATITVTPVGDADAVTRYNWTLNGEEIAEVTNVVNNAAPGMYVVEAIMAGGAVVASAEVELPDYGTLQVAITPASPQNVALNGSSTAVTYTAQVAGGSENYLYQWYMSGENGTEQPIAGANDQVYITPSNLAAGSYFYFVEVTDAVSGCVERSGVVQAIVASDILVRIEGIESACEGSTVTLTAVVEGDQIGHKYQWKYFGDYIIGATGAQYTFNVDSIGAGNHEFYVEITRDGCESVLSPVFYFDVIETPVVLAKGNSNICPNATTTFVAETYSSMIEQPYKWIWFSEAGDTIATTYENYYNFDQAGKYYVQSVFATSVCNAVSDTFEIKEARELQEIEIIEVDDTRFICDGGQVNFSIVDPNLATAEDSLYFGTPYYQWYVNGMKINGADKNYLLSSPLTADKDVTDYIFSVEVSYANYNCDIATDTFNVEVVANPTVVISGDPIICAGSNVKLTANVNDTLTDAVELTYQWRLDNVDIAEGKELDMLLEERVDPYTFTVVVKRNAGCVVESAPYQVLVNASPVVNVTSDADTVSDGGVVTFIAHLNDNNADNLMYQWYALKSGDTDTAANLIPGATEATYTTPALSGEEIYNYIVKVSQKTSSCEAWGSKSVVVVADPVINSISVSDTAICEGAPVIVAAHTSMNVSAEDYSYTWYRNGILLEGIVDSVFTDYPTVTDGDQAEYIYSAVMVQDVAGSEAKMAYSATVVVKANPTVVISGDPIICDGSNVQLTANVNDTLTDAAELTYQWRLDNVDIAEGKELDMLLEESVDPYTFTVVVKRNNGCETMSEPFQVQVNASPVVNVIATDAAICEGGEVTFTANLKDNNVDQLMYQWSMIDGDTIEIEGATQSTYTTTLSEQGEYEFVVTVRQKTSDCVATGSAKLTVVADPHINSINFSQTEICEGGAVEIEAIDTLAIGDEAVYTWYRNGMLLEGINGSKFVEYALTTDGDSTVYTYAVKVSQPISGCESAVYTAEQTVTVYANPSVEIEVAGSPVVCEGGQVTLTANVVGGTAATTYQWYRDNVALENETSNTLTIAGLTARENSYKYHVEVKQGATGCNNKSNVVDVTVVKAPVVTIASNYDAICEGGTATLSATIEGGVAGVNGLGTYNYYWMQNEDTIAEGQNTLVLSDTLTPGDYAYQLIIEPTDSTYNCGVASNVANVQVVADPVVTISIAADYDADVCEGGKTFLVSEVTGGLGENSYQWYRNGIILAGETNPTLVTDPELEAGSYTYTLFVTQTGVECAAISNELNSNVIAIPDVTIEGAENVCVGGHVTLNAEVTPADSSYSEYQWFRNGSPIYGATASSYQTSTALSAGDYTYTVTIMSPVSGCVAQSAAVDANVVADPQVVIMGAKDVCVGGSVVLTAEVIGGVEGAEYEYAWYLNGAQIAGANKATYTTPTNLAANNTADHYYYTVEISPVAEDGAASHGCNAISESVIADVIEGPVATITGNGTICEGGSLTLVANVAKPGVYYYQWYLNGKAIAGATSATYTTPNTLTVGKQQYSVEVAAGKSNENCTYTATADVEVVADPVVTVAASITEMCVGGKTVLTATVRGGMTDLEDVTYRWTRNGELLPNVTEATFTDMLTVAGTYEYVVTVEQNESSIISGCAAQSKAITVVVANQPDVTIVWDGLLDVCEGGSIQLTAQIEGGVGKYNYQWRRNNRILSDNSETLTTDTSLTYGEYNYTVTAIPTVESCKQTSDNVVTHVVTQPYWTSTVVRYPEMCEGEIIELLATVKGGVEDNNGNNGGFIIWKKSVDGEESNVAGELGGISYDIAKEGTYYYYPTYNGPMGSNCVLSAPEGTKVEVHATPTATATTAEGSDIICAHETAEIIVSFTGTAPFTFFVQDMNTNAVTSYTTYENPYSIFVNPTKTTTYHIYSLGDAFCDAAPNAADAYVTVVVSDLEFESDFVKVCPDNSSIATFHVTAISGAPTTFSTTGLSAYGMNDYTNEPFNGSDINIDFTNAEPGDYEFTILVDDCVYPVTVRVLMGTADGAGSVVEQRWDDVIAANNNPETNGGYKFVAFQWYKNGEAIPGATGQYYNEIGGLNGYYSLWAMTEDGKVFESCEISVSTSSRIKVYPTPAHVDQEVTIELPLTEEELEGGVLDIYDDKGALVQHVSVIEQVTKISGFHAAGTYFGRITTGTNEIKTVKFIIVH